MVVKSGTILVNGECLGFDGEGGSERHRWYQSLYPVDVLTRMSDSFRWVNYDDFG